MVAEMIGARTKTALSAACGVMSSFSASLMPSARPCSSPNGPTRLGPMRICIRATTRRSAQIMMSVATTRKPKMTTALMSDSHHGVSASASVTLGVEPHRSPPSGDADDRSPGPRPGLAADVPGDDHDVLGDVGDVQRRSDRSPSRPVTVTRSPSVSPSRRGRVGRRATCCGGRSRRGKARPAESTPASSSGRHGPKRARRQRSRAGAAPRRVTRPGALPAGELRRARPGSHPLRQPQVDVELGSQRREHPGVGHERAGGWHLRGVSLATLPVEERARLLRDGGDREHDVAPARSSAWWWVSSTTRWSTASQSRVRRRRAGRRPAPRDDESGKCPLLDRLQHRGKVAPRCLGNVGRRPRLAAVSTRAAASATGRPPGSSDGSRPASTAPRSPARRGTQPRRGTGASRPGATLRRAVQGTGSALTHQDHRAWLGAASGPVLTVGQVSTPPHASEPGVVAIQCALTFVSPRVATGAATR